ncbi:DNA internalization-related competence protein ComEC/Rec2 [Sporolactobacillus sp. Y61]|uniref:DNA internalization-related competence protein ComEC/Rec2 n=1 Tax=Sporolactobacillus sp. Y61 TaxID=3160863 RepID=A0AAU8IE67_9BACL
MITLTSKWHLAAFCACLSAWAAAGTQPAVPLVLLACYGIFLCIRKKFLMLGALTVIGVAVAADVFFFQINASGLSPRQNLLTGKIREIPVIDGDQLRYILETPSHEAVLVTYRIRTETEKEQLKRGLMPGLVCRVSGVLDRPALPTNFYAFNYRDYLEKHHIFRELQADGPPVIIHDRASPVDDLKRFRQHQVDRIYSLFSPTAAGMINALIFGEDQAFDSNLSNAYQLFGLVHLLVVSGMHIAVIFGCLYFVLKRIGMVREHISVLIMFLIPLYAVVTGAEPSVVRSALTACLLLGSVLLKCHKLLITDVLSLSCLMMIFFDPYVVFDIGFQLSFTVTFMVILCAPIINQKYRSPLTRVFMMAVMSELAAFPFAVYQFYQLSFTGFFLSIFFVPFITLIILPVAAVSYFMTLFSVSFAPVMSSFMDSLLLVPHNILLYLYHHPVLDLNYGAMAPWMLACSVVLFAVALILWESRQNKSALCYPIGSFLVVYLLVYGADLINPLGSVTFLDVGQGDSILIRLPHRQGNILIDSGGTPVFSQEKWRIKNHPFEVGRDVVLHELRAMRINKLDVVVLTHRDHDHVGGMESLVGSIPIKSMLVSPYFDPDGKDIAWFERAVREGTQLASVRSRDTFTTGDHPFTVMARLDRSAESNDNSVVIFTELGRKKWLFTGDLSVHGERDLLAQFPALHVDILKLGHHGSRTSTSELLLQSVRPSVGIVSAGKNNRYGHPHAEVLDKLNKYNMRTLRTDRDGAIRFFFNDRQILRIETAAIKD